MADSGDPTYRRVLVNLKHGGHVMDDDLVKADPEAVQLGAATLSMTTGRKRKKIRTTPFTYLFPRLQGLFPGAHLPDTPASTVVAGLKALGSAMVEQPPPAPRPGQPVPTPNPDNTDAGDSDIPPIYTYWGQFVDHDLTANTDRDDDIGITDLPLEPLQPEKVLHNLRNLREPQLNLDSVYGNGPGAPDVAGEVPYDGDKLRLGELVPFAGPATAHLVPVPGRFNGDLFRDENKKARIGDGRNDENLVIAQLQLSFLRFHNNVLDWLASEAGAGARVEGVSAFDRARQLVQWHYQWITVHDFLKTILDGTLLDGTDSVLDLVLKADPDPANTFGKLLRPVNDEAAMPLEFSVAAYRFGHSMVRGAYDWNINFGEGTGNSAPFFLLFLFTGNGGLGGSAHLPDNWPSQFERMTGAAPRPAGTPPGVPARFARKIDTHLAVALKNLSNEGTDPDLSLRIARIVKRLAVRNLLRGYRLGLPTGQAVAAELGIPPLTTTELLDGLDQGIQDALIDGNFLTATPLWFYVLRESEIRTGGNRLGPVGSRIVAETIVGQLRLDPTSFLHQTGTSAAGTWQPADGIVGSAGPVDSIIRLLQFADMHP